MPLQYFEQILSLTSCVHPQYLIPSYAPEVPAIIHDPLCPNINFEGKKYTPLSGNGFKFEN